MQYSQTIGNNTFITTGQWSMKIDGGKLQSVRFSDSFYNVLNIPPHKPEDRTIDTVFMFIHPDDIDFVRNKLKNLQNPGDDSQDWDLEYRMMTKDGYRWYHNCIHIGKASKDSSVRYINGVLFDVTEQKSSKTFLQTYVDTLADANIGLWHLFIKEGTTPRMQMNSVSMKLFGIEGKGLTEEQIYEHWYYNIEKKYMPAEEIHVQDMTDGKFSENQYGWHLPGQDAIYVRCGGSAVHLPDGTIHFSGYHRDVTQQVLKEQEREKELLDAKEAAEAASSAKTSFLFNMSHDIRTPMNAIIGYTDLLKKHQEEPEKREDYLRKIESSSNVLLSIINNVLEMARIEKGTIVVDDVAWAVGIFNDTIYSVFNDMMEQKGITFTREINVQHNYVFCDPTKLQKVFFNILSNAYKYTNRGGKVRMLVEEIPSDKEGTAIFRTTISDTGIGMSEEFLPHVFEEFTREKSSTENKIEGTGLGMPIVKRLVGIMGGTITVKSKKGEGTSFIVTILHRIADRKDLIGYTNVSVSPDEFYGKRILVTEDNELNAEIAIEILKEAGFEVDHAEDGAKCLEMLKKVPGNYYCAILMDIQMPNMNGYEATRAIRTLPDAEKASIPILAMTANAFEEDKREALRAGMDGHQPKPINVEDLKRDLARIIR